MGYDFSGWATRNDLKCSDGRIIRKNAFRDNDGMKVPLVWNHQHNEATNVLGHALLENRDEGVYAYCTLNDTEQGQNAKVLIEHGDISALSIYANRLKQEGSNVIHGAIREVSLVLAGANPGAFIDNIISHGEESDSEAIIFTGEDIEISHAEQEESPAAKEDEPKKEEKEMADDKTVKDVFDTLTEEQKTVVYALIGQAIEDAKAENGGNDNMKHNAFDTEMEMDQNVLTHAEIDEIFEDAKKYGSLKDSVLAHAATDSNGNSVTYGIADINYLFPDAKTLNNEPDFIKRDDSWVSKFMNAAHHSPFSRVKSIHANITAEDARARGYVKGNKKLEEVFTLLKRSTDPQTIYKKQKMDRDDILDITDFDAAAFVKKEMRGMLNEEIARAALIGDGRSTASEDHISADHIRPIWTDSDLYTINQVVTVANSATDDQKARAFIKACIKARKNYKGSGNPTLFTTEDVLTDMLLIEDTNQRVIYDSVDKLATALRVKEIVTVPVMENQTRTVDGATRNLWGIIINPVDYNFGADKGGNINFFDDFDIDFNQQKYLIETRCSGAMVKPYAAIAVEMVFQS